MQPRVADLKFVGGASTSMVQAAVRNAEKGVGILPVPPE